MFKFICFLSLYLLTGLNLGAQPKTKPAGPHVHKGRQNRGVYNPQPQASPGRNFTFKDALLIAGLPENMKSILAQKGFKTTKQEQPDGYARIDTFLYTNAAGEQLCFFYSNYSGGFLKEIIFRTPAQAKAGQLIKDAVKDGYRLIDSATNATGNDQESFLVRSLTYGTMPPQTVSLYDDAYQTFFTTSATYSKTTKLFSFHFFQELRQAPALIDPGPPVPGPPLPYKEPITGKVADTLVIGTGSPVLLFIETGLPATNYNKNLDPDSVAFFKKRNFFYHSFRALEATYPPDRYRYINIYKPTMVRLGNNKKESLYYPPANGYSEFVYWSGKATDQLYKHPDWQDAEYIVSNATGDNQLRKGYKSFVADSLTVARIRSLPVGQPSPQVLQGMNQFIAKAVWKDALLYFPQLDLKQVRRITVSSNNVTAQYYFNRNGQLDSITDQKSSGKIASSSYEVRKVLYKNDLPAAAYNRYDTVYFKYAGDTLFALQDVQLLRYKREKNSFNPIDKFKTWPDKYLRNNIRDYSSNNDFVDLEPSSEKDADGTVWVAGASDYRGIKNKYIFRKGQLQQIHVTGRDTDIRYFVFIEKYP